MNRSVVSDEKNIRAEIKNLSLLTMKELWVVWDNHFDFRPGNHHRSYLEGRLAYRIQEVAYGALSASIKKRLEKIGETGDIPNHKRRSEHDLLPGTKLLRVHEGHEHRVEVLEDGRYLYLNKPFNSLSSIARAITGTNWSGPAFFGLKKQKAAKERAHA